MAEPLTLRKVKDLGVFGQTRYVTGTATLGVDETDIRITTAASVAYTITLPHIDSVPVGHTIYGRVISDGGTGDVTIADAAGNDILGDALSALNDNFSITNHIGVWKVNYETTT